MEALKEHIITAYSNKIPTQKTYLNTYKQLSKLKISDEDMIDNDKVVQILNDCDYSASSKRSMLNLIIIHRSRVYGEEVDKRNHPLSKYREQVKEEERVVKVQKKEQLQKELPSRKKLLTYMNNEFDKGNYKNYIINYMLLNYYVRNVDCNVVLFVKHNPEQDDCNYLIINEDNVVWKRNKYKTSHLYGKQEHIITDERFNNSCRELFTRENGNKDNGVPLLRTSKNTQVEDSNCGWYVANSTYQGIGEGKYLKINLHQINNKKNTMNILNKISETRGSGAKHLITDYNITETY